MGEGGDGVEGLFLPFLFFYWPGCNEEDAPGIPLAVPPALRQQDLQWNSEVFITVYRGWMGGGSLITSFFFLSFSSSMIFPLLILPCGHKGRSTGSSVCVCVLCFCCVYWGKKKYSLHRDFASMRWPTGVTNLAKDVL